MRLYSFQSLDILNKLELDAVLYADSRLGIHYTQVHEGVTYYGFEEPYAWMKKAFTELRGIEPTGDLWWAWRDEPDLNKWRYRYTSHVLLHLEVPDSEVLLSDHHAWHDVLHDSHCSFTEEESNFWWKEYCGYDYGKDGDAKIRGFKLTPEKEIEKKQIKGKSWYRIFDLEAVEKSVWLNPNQKSIFVQAVFPELRKADIVKVVHYNYGRHLSKLPRH